jgi:hypothetical protein
LITVVVYSPWVREHANFISEDDFHQAFTGAHFPGYLLVAKFRERSIGKAVRADLEAFSS